MFLAFSENMGTFQVVAHLCYISSVTMFMVALLRLGRVKTARSGNWLAMAAMALAIGGQFLEQMNLDAGLENAANFNWLWITIGLSIGTIAGLTLALLIKMTAMPEMVGLLNGFGGFASMLVGIAAFTLWAPLMDDANGVAYTFAQIPGIGWFNGINLMLTIMVGAVTFSGSVLAFAKLSEWFNKKFPKLDISKPKLVPGRHFISAFLLIVPLTLGALSVFSAGGKAFGITAVVLITLMSLLLGVMLVAAIGGGDMPVVICLLNSYSGIAGALSGFTINSPVLVVAGSLVGASGIILTRVMCKAMNRSFFNVLFGGFGAVDTSAKTDDGYNNVRSADVEEAAMALADAQSCIIVPGYGMAVAQAQHAVRELADALIARGCKLRYAIHPVAGRMPGHMNVLLAEANVPYDLLYEMDAINNDFQNTDVAIVIGANDVVNPAAKDNKSSPLYGMPVLNVDQARRVFVIKRSLGAGFAGVKNELFEKENVQMIYADGRKACEELLKALKEA